MRVFQILLLNTFCVPGSTISIALGRNLRVWVSNLDVAFTFKSNDKSLSNVDGEVVADATSEAFCNKFKNMFIQNF